MKMLAMWSPICRTIHSSKFLGFDLVTALSMAASMRPSMAATWSSLGSMEMLFWKG